MVWALASRRQQPLFRRQQVSRWLAGRLSLWASELWASKHRLMEEGVLELGGRWGTTSCYFLSARGHRSPECDVKLHWEVENTRAQWTLLGLPIVDAGGGPARFSFFASSPSGWLIDLKGGVWERQEVTTAWTHCSCAECGRMFLSYHGGYTHQPAAYGLGSPHSKMNTFCEEPVITRNMHCALESPCEVHLGNLELITSCSNLD